MLYSQYCRSLLLIGSPSRARHSLRPQVFQAPNCRRHSVWVCRSSSGASVTGSSGRQQLRITTKKVLKQLSSLNLAIGELAAIAGLSVIGTIIKQNETAEFYIQNYPGISRCLPPFPASCFTQDVCASTHSAFGLQRRILSPFGSSGSCSGITSTQPTTSWLSLHCSLQA